MSKELKLEDKKDHTAYNPDDYFCQVCAYKSCLRPSKGRNILRKKILEIENKRNNKINI
ncbi:hypothetical protein [Persephonella sp.]